MVISSDDEGEFKTLCFSWRLWHKVVVESFFEDEELARQWISCAWRCQMLGCLRTAGRWEMMC